MMFNDDPFSNLILAIVKPAIRTTEVDSTGDKKYSIYTKCDILKNSPNDDISDEFYYYDSYDDAFLFVLQQLRCYIKEYNMPVLKRYISTFLLNYIDRIKIYDNGYDIYKPYCEALDPGDLIGSRELVTNYVYNYIISEIRDYITNAITNSENILKEINIMQHNYSNIKPYNKKENN